MYITDDCQPVHLLLNDAGATHILWSIGSVSEASSSTLRWSQVFDVLPLSGLLPPGETQQVQLTFYGHSGLAVQAVAVCQVEGGPAYHVHLRGEAAQVTYHLDRTTVDCGKQVGGGGALFTTL